MAEGIRDRDARKAALFREHVQLVQFLPQLGGNLAVNAVVLEHRVRRVAQAAHHDQRAVILQTRIALHVRITAREVAVYEFLPQRRDARP